ncbi:MAG: tRNA uridine-5-carboxymethylaminomethyl(34) synthesis GTPase MnmE [Clostridia bacterium]|nr:tRNA uridine-5-carboxymethylaminomethyl(34) synthesis GTPase MnmE [Clostridia bacterium]
MINDTIVAQATAAGKSGINIIRVSGKNSLDIAVKIFYCKKIKDKVEPNYMYLGYINLGEIKDKCFMVYFKNPNSFTGEDVVEFHCHGGFIVAKKIIDNCVENGARLAEPGEFSKRAFLNGKMSLDEAEGVIETINAQTNSQLKAGNDLTSGNLFKQVKKFQEELTDIISEIEVNLDYPEHDIEYQTKLAIEKRLKTIKDDLIKLLSTETTGKLIKNGVNIAIVGKTNVGKSSLLNALINYEHAIVTDIEGTTRDVVSAELDYKGMKFNFFDTAGIRQTNDIIENIGIEKSKQVLNTSDVALYIFDSSKPLDEEDKKVLKQAQNKNSIVVFNKCDLNTKIDFSGEHIKVSAKQRINTEELKQKIYDIVTQKLDSQNGFVLTNTRHIYVLKTALSIVEQCLSNIHEFTLDCVALDIKTIWTTLGEITGETADEAILDKIFSKFCLGK